MSKKFIALVLFAAMLVALIPTAAAEVNYTGTYPVVNVVSDGWYAGQNVEDLDAALGEKDALNPGVNYQLGERWLNNKMTDGLTVKLDAKKDKSATDTTKVSQNINISGSYSELQPFYYSYLAQNGVMGLAVKIPVRIAAQGEGQSAATNVSNSAYISGAAGYMNTYANASTEVAYITVVLGEADGTYTYKVWYANSEMYTITVTWDNTDNDAAATFGTGVPTLTVVGVAGDQNDNFRADFTKQASWKEDKDATGAKVWYYKPATLQFNITAMTKDDRAAIMSELTDYMTIKVKALDKNGYTYPQGTIVTFQGQADQDMFLGASDKFVTVNAEASYLIDNTGCFTMSFSGIKNFATLAGIAPAHTRWNAFTSYDYTTKSYTATHVAADLVEYKTIDTANNVYLYTLVSGGLQKEEDAVVTQHNVSKKVAGAFVLRFAYGNTAEEVGFNLKYQNTERTASGITLLTDVITVKVGEQVGIPYIIDNPMAYDQELIANWKIVNEGIAKYGTDTNGDEDKAVIKGVKVGTTYAFCTDAEEEVELVIINVVPADYVEAPVVEEVVEVGTKYVVTASRLNVREGAGTSYSRIRQIDRNTVVTGTEVEGSVWVKLNDGGYVHGKYLAEVE